MASKDLLTANRQPGPIAEVFMLAEANKTLNKQKLFFLLLSSKPK